jgi:hypothetical protein
MIMDGKTRPEILALIDLMPCVGDYGYVTYAGERRAIFVRGVHHGRVFVDIHGNVPSRYEIPAAEFAEMNYLKDRRAHRGNF